MVSTRRTPSRLLALPEGIALASKTPLKSVKLKRVAVEPRSLHYDISEPEASSDASNSDDSASSPPVSPQRQSLRLSQLPQNRPSSGLEVCKPAKSTDVIPVDKYVAPYPRRCLGPLSNIPLKPSISKSQSVPQSISKTLTSLCDKLVVQETPKRNSDIPQIHLDFPNVFSHARHLLKLSSTDTVSSEELLGRPREVLKLKNFVHKRFADFFEFDCDIRDSSSTQCDSSSGSLYISGPPGTGKTHMMKSVLLNGNHEIGRTLQNSGIQVHFINCVALSTSTGISGGSSGTGSNALDERLWSRIATCLGICCPAPKKGKNLTTRALVEAHIMNRKITPRIIILDEIDHLATSKIPLITPLLSLSQNSPGANFTVIGIANTLDLTTRFSKSLISSNSDNQVEPELIHFSSFGFTDMIDIVKQRLKHLHPSYATSRHTAWPASTPQKLFASSSQDDCLNQGPDSVPLFHAAALQLCAKKVSAVTGDLRTFLSISRKLIESAERNIIQNNQFLQQTSSGQKSVLDTPTKMRKFTRIISTSQLAPDLRGQSSENEWPKTKTDPCSHFTPTTAPKISPGDVIKYLKTSGILEQPTFNTSQAECLKKLQDLNLHQSIVLVCLCVAWSRAQDEFSSAEYRISRSQAYEVYRDCLKPGDGYGRRNTFNIGITPVSESEWTDLLESGLQTKGLVSCSNGRTGLSSCPLTPSASHSKQVLSPFKSPSKRKQGPFQRSILCTPTKSKPTGLNSPHSTSKPSPSRSSANDRSTGQVEVAPVHSISVLIQSIQSLAEQKEVLSDNAPRFSPEIISILNQLLIAEEKRSRLSKKRKAAEMVSQDAMGRKGEFQRLDDDEIEQENFLKRRLVTAQDEGSCRD